MSREVDSCWAHPPCGKGLKIPAKKRSWRSFAGPFLDLEKCSLDNSMVFLLGLRGYPP